MKCPKCGYIRQSRDHVFAPPTECPACGVIYSKYGVEGLLPTGGHPQDIASGLKRPSPVHEDSLKQARERVERRLRKKFNADEKDEIREQTLQRARKFVSEGIRRRQEEKKRVESHEQQDSLVEDQNEVPFETQTASDSTERIPPPETDIDKEETASDEMAEIHTTTEADEAAQTQPEAIMTSQTADSQLSDKTADGEDDMAEKDVLDEPDMDRPAPTEVASHDPENASTAPPEEMETQAAIVASSYHAAESQDSLTTPHTTRTRSDHNLLRLLPAVAWLILVAGIVGAILSWTTLSDVRAGTNGTINVGHSDLPIALLLGFAYLATGVLGFAFFWVSSMINTQLKEIRRILLQAPREH